MVKVAIVGCGGIGKFHSTVYTLLPDVKVIATADIRREQAELAAQAHQAGVFASMNDLLEAEKPDVVDICTPTHLHPEMSIHAMQAGCHVLCEKPMALDVESAESMLGMAQKSGVTLMIAQVIRFWDEYVYLKNALDQQTFGPLKQAWFSRTGSTPRWSWDNWFLDEQRSGLAPFDLHIHDTDYIYHLLGKPGAVRSAWIYEPGNPDFSYIHSDYQYPGDVLVGAEGGWCPARVPFLATYRAIFAEAALEYRSDGGLTCFPNSSDPYPISLGEPIPAPSGINIHTLRPYYNEIRYYIDCIQGGVEPAIAPARQTCDSLRLLLAEIQSAKNSLTVELR